MFTHIHTCKHITDLDVLAAALIESVANDDDPDHHDTTHPFFFRD